MCQHIQPQALGCLLRTAHPCQQGHDPGQKFQNFLCPVHTPPAWELPLVNCQMYQYIQPRHQGHPQQYVQCSCRRSHDLPPCSMEYRPPLSRILSLLGYPDKGRWDTAGNSALCVQHLQSVADGQEEGFLT